MKQLRKTVALLLALALLAALPAEYTGQPREGATFLVGCYTLAMTVYLLAPALTQTLGVSALPRVTAAWARQDRHALRESVSAVCRGAALVCFPAGLGMSVLATPITQVLFGRDASAPITASALQVLGLAALGAGLTVPLNSILQAVGRADLPVKLLAVALALKTASTWFLSGVPELGLLGAAWSSVGCYALLAAAELLAVRRVTGLSLPWGELLGVPLAGAALCALAARTAFLRLEPALGTLPALAFGVCLGAAVHGASALLLGGFQGLKKPVNARKNRRFLWKTERKPVSTCSRP